MENLQLVQELENAIEELDYNKVSWIDKHLVIDLNQKAQVLLESVTRLEEVDKQNALDAAQEFLAEVNPVIEELNNQEKKEEV